jgi:hypothetical protein
MGVVLEHRAKVGTGFAKNAAANKAHRAKSGNRFFAKSGRTFGASFAPKLAGHAEPAGDEWPRKRMGLQKPDREAGLPLRGRGDLAYRAPHDDPAAPLAVPYRQI